MDPNEPPFIKYEEILLPDEESSPESSKEEEEEESDDSSDETGDKEEEDEMEEDTSSDESQQPEDRADRIRSETVGRILDAIFVPRKIVKEDGQSFLVRLSRDATSRDDVIELSEKFEQVVAERQVRMKGFCPIRRELYDLLFDELIRESTLQCAERGSLLLRVRDEFRMTLDAHERLFASGVAYGARAALEGDAERRRVEIQYNHLKAEVQNAEEQLSSLRAEMEASEKESRQRTEARQARHQERMAFLHKLNAQLKEQISYIKPNS